MSGEADVEGSDFAFIDNEGDGGVVLNGSARIASSAYEFAGNNSC